MVKSITDLDFMNVVIQSDKLVLVDFWAEWCGPCRQLAPVLEQLDSELKGEEVCIFKMDVDANPNIPTQYGIRSIPTLILFKNGSVVSTKVGALPKNALLQWIKEHI